MNTIFRSLLSRTAFIFCVASSLSSCISRPWRPVNVGRENGSEKTPLIVSHLPEKNKWVMARTKSHNLFQRILCFDYTCRRMIGRKKGLGAISFKEFTKQIAKNGKKGIYKNMTPAVPAPVIKKQKRDTVMIKKDTIKIATVKSKPAYTAPVLKRDSLITLGDLLFETDSYNLKGKHFSQLDSVSQFLLAHTSLEVSVSGHTDNTGNEKHNVTLSMQRAEVVAQYLVNKGVASDQVFFEGFGSTKPIRGNDTAESRSKNRRVEILLRDPKRK